MFKIGQKVLVIYQRPPVEATILQKDTWGRINGTGSTDICYEVGCPEWIPRERWLGEGSLKELPTEEPK